MSLRPLSYRVVRKKLLAAGFTENSQEGSHVKFVKTVAGYTRTVIAIDHPGDMAKGTLRSLIKAAGLTVEEFNSL